MLSKILVVDKDQEDRDQLEEILSEVLETGGELFFSGDTEEALALIDKEKPQIVFLDEALIGPDEDRWVKEGIHIVVVQEAEGAEQRGEDFLIKPLTPGRVLAKCAEALDLSLHSPKIPPM